MSPNFLTNGAVLTARRDLSFSVALFSICILLHVARMLGTPKDGYFCEVSRVIGNHLNDLLTNIALSGCPAIQNEATRATTTPFVDVCTSRVVVAIGTLGLAVEYVPKPTSLVV